MWDAASSDILAVWKRAVPRNRMREILTSGSVGGLVEQSPILPGRCLTPSAYSSMRLLLDSTVDLCIKGAISSVLSFTVSFPLFRDGIAWELRKVSS